MFSPPKPHPPTPPPLKSARLITSHSLARTLTLWGPGKLFLKLMVATISCEPGFRGGSTSAHEENNYYFFLNNVILWVHFVLLLWTR
jgi:hypothetical protein